MNNNDFTLIDTTEKFILRSSNFNSDIEIDYGLIVLSLLNTDFDEINHCIKDFFDKYLREIRKIIKEAREAREKELKINFSEQKEISSNKSYIDEIPDKFTKFNNEFTKLNNEVAKFNNIAKLNNNYIAKLNDKSGVDFPYFNDMIIESKKIYADDKPKRNFFDSSYFSNFFISKEFIRNELKYFNLILVDTELTDKMREYYETYKYRDFEDLFKDISECLATDYLKEEQAVALSSIIYKETKDNFYNKRNSVTDTSQYVPDIYLNENLNKYIKYILENNQLNESNPIQNIMNNKKIKLSIISYNDKMVQCYRTPDILTYLLIDLQKYMISDKKVNRCKCCNRFFYPKSRKSEKYCSFNNSKCKEIMKRVSNDEFAGKRDYYRKYQRSRTHNESTIKKYDKNFLHDLYCKYSIECGEKYIEYKSKNDLQGFQDWLNNTKFTAKRLQEIWKKYQEENKQ